MGLKTKKILGIDVTVSQNDEILEEVQKYLFQIPNSKFQIPNKRVKPLVIFTPNPEIITYAGKDETFARIVNSAQINLPDGAGVVWALKKLYGLDAERIQGVDFMSELVKMAHKESFRIGLIGGRGGVAVDTLECLRQNHPKLPGWAMDGPEITISKIKNQKAKIHIKRQKLQYASDGGRLKRSGSHDSSEVEESEDSYFISLINEIRERKADILFIAMGFPKQEYFISQLSVVSCQLSVRPLVLMAVGGAFDYISRRVPRAPKWMRNIGLEWLYRLVREPWRLSRMIKGGEFFLRIAFSSFFPIKYP